jgi:hypothetical protein
MTDTDNTTQPAVLMNVATMLSGEYFSGNKAPTAEEITEAEAAALFSMLVTTIELYSERTDYRSWNALSEVLAEHFEQDKINEQDRSYLWHVEHSSGEKDHEYLWMTTRTAEALRGDEVIVTRKDPMNQEIPGSALTRLQRAAQTVTEQAYAFNRRPRPRPSSARPESDAPLAQTVGQPPRMAAGGVVDIPPAFGISID